MGLLHDAAAEGDLGQIERLLQADPSAVNARDEHGRTSLHYAAIEGHVDVADTLLAQGAEIDVRDTWSRTPLFVAIFEEPLVCDHTPIVRFLISKGADVTLGDQDGDTPLHIAATVGEMEIAALLLQRGADINVQNHRGETPLHKAVLYPEANVTRLLLSQDAIDVHIRNREGLTPLDIVHQKGWTELAHLFTAPPYSAMASG